jgi:hypothetical protein
MCSKDSKLCTAPYTLCALAFTGGIGNTVIQSQTGSDPGDCSTLFSSTCASDLKAAVGTTILSEGDKANATAIMSGDVCLALSTSLKIPGSCSEVTDVLSHRTAQGERKTKIFFSFLFPFIAYIESRRCR